MFNKDSRHTKTLMKSKFNAEQMAQRTNFLLLGDGTGDATMADGAAVDVSIKIGFLNEKVDQRRAEYSRIFDALVLHDGGMEEVNEILKEVISGGSSAFQSQSTAQQPEL
jgi:hypothetical protein